ncbi:hypothetical protein GGI02_005038, partial [Coemansia sp. RSA 2322]
MNRVRNIVREASFEIGIDSIITGEIFNVFKQLGYSTAVFPNATTLNLELVMDNDYSEVDEECLIAK